MHRENLSGSIYEAIWEMRFKSLCRFYQLNHRDKLWIERLQLLKAFKQEYGRWPRNKDSYRGTAVNGRPIIPA